MDAQQNNGTLYLAIMCNIFQGVLRTACHWREKVKIAAEKRQNRLMDP